MDIRVRRTLPAPPPGSSDGWSFVTVRDRAIGRSVARFRWNVPDAGATDALWRPRKRPGANRTRTIEPSVGGTKFTRRRARASTREPHRRGDGAAFVELNRMDNDPRMTERTEPVTRETQHPPRAASEGNRAQNSSTETKPRAKGRPLGTTRKMRRVTPGSSASIETLTERIRTIRRERVLPVLARIAAHEDAIASHRESARTTTHTSPHTTHTTHATTTTMEAPAENAFIASESDDVD